MVEANSFLKGRRTRLAYGLGLLCFLANAWTAFSEDAARGSNRPNVLLIMTDDQGYGDLGVNGNPIIRTQNIDRLATQGVRLEQFHVCPVCTPTRACLMTGRYNQRTRAIDTFRGRAMMDPDETTVAEILSKAGYRTGIFGKWHLGDNYPLRACDQGFAESLVHRGGGLAQPSGPPGEGYFDPELLHNGKPVKTKGYCTDIFTDAAIEFLRANEKGPWFCYVAYNCPHSPYQLPKEDEEEYSGRNLGFDQFPKSGFPLRDGAMLKDLAKVYGMVTRIDRGIGRMLEVLEEAGVADNTMVIFLTDNGPQWVRYNGGMRGTKGTVYEGGIRVPCFVRWPATIPPGSATDGLAAHIDLTPTILAACGVPTPEGVCFDGINLLPMLTGKTERWPERTLFFQWHRGDRPERYRAFAAREGKYKLVQAEGTREGPFEASQAKFELYDLSSDPYEMKDIADANPAIVDGLKKKYDAWFDDVCGTRGFDPPRILVGTKHENPTTLTRQDWRGDNSGLEETGNGHWLVRIGEPGRYDITLRFPKRKAAATARIKLDTVEREMEIPAGAERAEYFQVELPVGDARIDATIEAEGRAEGAHYVDIRRL